MRQLQVLTTDWRDPAAGGCYCVVCWENEDDEGDGMCVGFECTHARRSYMERKHFSTQSMPNGSDFASSPRAISRKRFEGYTDKLFAESAIRRQRTRIPTRERKNVTSAVSVWGVRNIASNTTPIASSDTHTKSKCDQNQRTCVGTCAGAVRPPPEREHNNLRGPNPASRRGLKAGCVACVCMRVDKERRNE